MSALLRYSVRVIVVLVDLLCRSPREKKRKRRRKRKRKKKTKKVNKNPREIFTQILVTYCLTRTEKNDDIKAFACHIFLCIIIFFVC